MKSRVILATLLSGFILTAGAIIPRVTEGAGYGYSPVALFQEQSSRPVRTIPGLQNITVWTQTSRGPTSFTLGVNGSEFTTRLGGLLGPSNRDFSGPNAPEFYDVFYSDSDGAFNLDGSYITVESGGGGLSLAEIWLQFSGDSVETGNLVASFVAFGSNLDSNSVANAIDNDINTFTRLGNSVAPGDGRRRITVGFQSSSAPAGPALFIEDVGVTEGDAGTTNAVFRVRLSPQSSMTVTLDYSTEDFSATSPSDYTTVNGALTFNSGETLKTITVPVRGDTLYEATEQFFVNLANPVNAVIGRGQGAGTIVDDEPGAFTICSNDVPKSTGLAPGRARSVIAVDRDGMIDDINVSLFIEATSGTPPVNVDLLAPDGERGETLIRNIRPLGGRFGTTCSPSPNCVFDEEAATRIEEASPDYVGSFKSYSFPLSDLRELERRSPRGTWTLDLSSGQGIASILNCWCLQFELPREGCRITPERATARVFFTHRVRALLTSNGAAVSDQPVTFTVRGEQGELRFQGEGTSNELGEAIFSYFDFKPGVNTIEARAMINGVPSIGTAHVTWVVDGLSDFNIDRLCPIEELSAGASEAAATLSAARGFRDSVLARSPRGQRYASLYYEHSTEAVQVMMFNPMIILRSREILERYKPLIEAMARGEAITLTEGDLDEIDGFLNYFAAKGSARLQETVKNLCRDLRDRQMHEEFNLTVTAGPKRGLPGGRQIQGVSHFGGLTLFFGIFGLVIFAATGKRQKVMRRSVAHLLVVLLTMAVLTSGLALPIHKSSRSARRGQEAKRPLARVAFEANQGQTDPQVKFISRVDGYDLFLTPTEAVMRFRGRKSKVESQTSRPLQMPAEAHSLTGDVLRMRLIDANPEPEITGLDLLPLRSNYFTGNDSAKWRASLPSYARVEYQDVYDGVNLLYHSNRGELEYDFIVAPGANPEAIGLTFEGSDKIAVDAAGDLVLEMSESEVRQRKPMAYQEVNGTRREVRCRYVIQNHTVGFEVGEYDKSRPLVIDPVIQYSTYLGGSRDDQGNAITVDASGNAYIVGFTDSLDFPLASAEQNTFGGRQDVFVSKLDPSGAQLLYSTYLGGDGQDNGSAIAVDAAGNTFITGYTGSTDFPVINAVQSTKSGPFNAFIARLDPSGNLIYSTHLGGSVGDFGSSIAVDASGAVYVAGVATSPDFPMRSAAQNEFSGASDVYVAKLTPSGDNLVYSTYLGGADNDGATGIAVDSAGNVYVTGITMSLNFRTANPLQSAHRGGLLDAFVAKLNPSGAQLIYSTYLGGSGEDRAFRIAVDSSGGAYVTGDTDSTNFPLASALQPNKRGGVDAFIAKLNPTGTALVYSTYLGGSGIEGGTAIAVDFEGSSYVTGFTSSSDFPTVAALQQTFGEGSFDSFVAKLNASGAALDYSTYLGGSHTDSGFGIAVDASGNAYVIGITDSSDFPTAAPLQAAYGGGAADLFVVKIGSGPQVTGVEIQNKKLLVKGSGFDSGAKILIDGQEQKTKNDNQNPTGLLIAKKAGKKIKRDRTVTVQVRNSDGALSSVFPFRRP